MKFVSTSGCYEVTSFSEAITTGYLPDGSMLMPGDLPLISDDILSGWRGLNYPSLLSKFLYYVVNTNDPIYEYLADIESETFNYFKNDVAPLKKLKNFSVLELFHGPTLSFKDYSLFPLAYLIDKVVKIKRKHSESSSKQKHNFLVCTTGDTGSSALEASKQYVDTINTFVAYPKSRITECQKLQMITSNTGNGHAIECSETNDELEEYIQTIYLDDDFVKLYNVSGFNSINCGRIICQMAIHVYAFLQVSESNSNHVNVAIPCGGLGNLISALLVRSMNLPINIILCNNENDLGHQMMVNGTVERKPEAHLSWSSAMDSIFPCNLERLLWILSDRDTKMVKTIMDKLKNYEKVPLPAKMMEKMRREIIDSISVNDNETIETMAKCFKEENYIICPHGATAVSFFYKNESMKGKRNVVIGTASIEKFHDAAVKAGILNDSDDDILLSRLREKPKVFTPMDYSEDPIQYLKRYVMKENQ